MLSIWLCSCDSLPEIRIVYFVHKTEENAIKVVAKDVNDFDKRQIHSTSVFPEHWRDINLEISSHYCFGLVVLLLLLKKHITPLITNAFFACIALDLNITFIECAWCMLQLEYLQKKFEARFLYITPHSLLCCIWIGSHLHCTQRTV